MKDADKPLKPVPVLKAVFTGKCPVCREGVIYGHAWHSSRFMENNKRCPACDVDFEPEPGFFYGAMYISYSLNVATFVAVSLFLYVLFNPESPFWYIGGVLGVTILGLPFIWRFSRLLWIYLFGPYKYDRDVASNVQGKSFGRFSVLEGEKYSRAKKGLAQNGEKRNVSSESLKSSWNQGNLPQKTNYEDQGTGNHLVC